MLIRILLIIIVLTIFSECKNSESVNDQSEQNFYTQTTNRVAAEWEPAVGTMIVWPLSIPYKLVVELAKDNQLVTMVENETSKREAIAWYTKWGIDSTKTTFIYAPQGIDSWWVRDWGPSAVFSQDGKMRLADGKYIYSTPVTDLDCNDSLYFIYQTKDHEIIKTEIDDDATVFMGKELNQEVVDLPFINTGGNVLTDGLGTAFSTCILLNENRFFGVTDDKFKTLNKEMLGFERYNVISNFEKRGIQHIDCYMKLLDEERILVVEPPKDHELFDIYENIINQELSKLKTAYGRPYQILRIKTDRYLENDLAAYTNSIIINKTIYVPLFKIVEDQIALQRWQEVMPGYTIKGFEFDLADEPIVTQQMKDHYRTNYGWDSGDALHCRTRAIWDAEMLFISVKHVDSVINSSAKAKVYATIIDYSKKGLMEDPKLLWRYSGASDWNSMSLKQLEETHYLVEIPYQKSGVTIEYYISATSNSGRTETQPRTAPKGLYNYSIK